MKPAVLVTPMAASFPKVEGALYVGVDAGALLLLEEGIEPDFIVGDFDSLEEKDVKCLESRKGFKRFPVMKDETDTQLALTLVQDCSPVYLCGAFGGRLDHTLANLSLQIYSCRDLILMGDGQYSRIYEKGRHEIEKVYRHVSFFALVPSRITLKGLLYPLENRLLQPQEIYTISNAFTADPHPLIDIQEGRILCVQSEKP